MERRKKRNRNITYRQGNFNPELDAHIFNKMNGTAQFDGFGGGLAEDYNDAIKIKYLTPYGREAYGYTTMEWLREMVDGVRDYIWFSDSREDAGRSGWTLNRRNLLKVYGNSEEARIANGYIRKMTEDYDDYDYDDYGQNPVNYSIMISSGHGTVRELMGGFESFDEAYDALERLCALRPYGWTYIDENGFEWDAFIDEERRNGK